MKKKPDTSIFSIRFLPHFSRDEIVKILASKCCYSKVWQVREQEIGGKNYQMVVADLCMCHLDEIRGDDRIPHWEETNDLTPRSCGEDGDCGNC